MLRFEVQNPTEEQKGGNHTALQGVKHVKRKLPHLRSVVSRSELGETYGCKLLAGQRVLVTFMECCPRVTLVPGANLLLVGFSQLPQDLG